MAWKLILFTIFFNSPCFVIAIRCATFGQLSDVATGKVLAKKEYPNCDDASHCGMIMLTGVYLSGLNMSGSALLSGCDKAAHCNMLLAINGGKMSTSEHQLSPIVASIVRAKVHSVYEEYRLDREFGEMTFQSFEVSCCKTDMCNLHYPSKEATKIVPMKPVINNDKAFLYAQKMAYFIQTTVSTLVTNKSSAMDMSILTSVAGKLGNSSVEVCFSECNLKKFLISITLCVTQTQTKESTDKNTTVPWKTVVFTEGALEHKVTPEKVKFQNLKEENKNFGNVKKVPTLILMVFLAIIVYTNVQ